MTRMRMIIVAVFVGLLTAGSGWATNSLIEQAWQWHQQATGDEERQKALELYKQVPEAAPEAAVAQYNASELERNAGNPIKAHELLEKSAHMGYGPALHNLAVLAQEKGNAEEAMRYYRRASARGVGESAMNIALMYLEGVGTTKDTEEAAFWFETAWEAGIAQGAYGRAMIAEHDGADSVARQWMAKAAKANYGPAQGRYGFYWGTGLGGEENLARAKRWLDKASENVDASMAQQVSLWQRSIQVAISKKRHEQHPPQTLSNAVVVGPQGQIVAPIAAVNRAQGRPLRAWIPPGSYVAVHEVERSPRLGLVLLQTGMSTPDYLPAHDQLPLPIGKQAQMYSHVMKSTAPLPRTYKVYVKGRLNSPTRSEYLVDGIGTDGFLGAAIIHPDGGWGAVVVPASSRGGAATLLGAEEVRKQWPQLPNENPREPRDEAKRRSWIPNAVARLMVEDPVLLRKAKIMDQ